MRPYDDFPPSVIRQFSKNIYAGLVHNDLDSGLYSVFVIENNEQRSEEKKSGETSFDSASFTDLATYTYSISDEGDYNLFTYAVDNAQNSNQMNSNPSQKAVRKMSGKTKNYTEEFKKQIVQLSKSGRSANSIAKDYGVSKSSVMKWVRDFNNSGSFKAKDNRTPEENELIELRKRVKELEMEADILKQAALIMARKSK